MSPLIYPVFSFALDFLGIAATLLFIVYLVTEYVREKFIREKSFERGGEKEFLSFPIFSSSGVLRR